MRTSKNPPTAVDRKFPLLQVNEVPSTLMACRSGDKYRLPAYNSRQMAWLQDRIRVERPYLARRRQLDVPTTADSLKFNEPNQ